ncbi:hypothetical protein AHAS_Ahas19G0101700 [Arachis hypogaea]
MGMDKFLETHGIHLEREDDDFEPSAENERFIQEKQQNLRKINIESSCQAMTLDTFFETNGIHVEGEEEHSGANANEVGDDDDNDEDYVGEYEDVVLHGDDNDLMETNNVEGPTSVVEENEMVSEQFVPIESEDELIMLLDILCSKFILPKEGKKWVMTGVREVWKHYKTRINKKHFEIYNNIEDMLKNRPSDILEVQFQKLIAYWSIPSAKREMNENKEDPSQVDVIVATRTEQKEKSLIQEHKLLL